MTPPSKPKSFSPSAPSSTELEEIARETAREIYTQIEASHYSFDVVREIILAALTKVSSLKKTPDSLGT